MMGYGAAFGFGHGGWLIGLGVVLVIAGLVVVIAWALLRSATSSRTDAPPSGWVAPASWARPAQPPAGPDPMEVLRLRFARGEIDQEQFLAAKQVLEQSR